MALINCKECNHAVSDTAASCPSCGAPVSSVSRNEVKGTGAQVVTVQKTAKRFKAHWLISWALIIGGFSIVAEPDLSAASPLMILCGFTLLIVTRIRKWWHHA